MPQFFYLIHQRITSEAMKKALARGFLRTAIATNVRLRDLTGLNPGKVLFGCIHRTLGARMRLFVTGGSKFDPAISRDLYGLGFTILNAYLDNLARDDRAPGRSVQRIRRQAVPRREIRILPRDSNSDQDRTSWMTAKCSSAGRSSCASISTGPTRRPRPCRMAGCTLATLAGWMTRDGCSSPAARKKSSSSAPARTCIPKRSKRTIASPHSSRSSASSGRAGRENPRPSGSAPWSYRTKSCSDGGGQFRELIRFEVETLSLQLPSHKRILTYDISLEPLPRTTTGKIRRHEIQRTLGDRAASRSDETREESAEDRAWRTPEGRETLALIATRLDRPDVRPDANLELDLGLDSMERVELLTVLEQRRGTRVADAVRATIFTVRQLVEAVSGARHRHAG